MKFSERIGAVRRVLQKDSMDDALKNALWNVAFVHFWKRFQYDSARYVSNVAEGNLMAALWANNFDQPLDLLGDYFPSAFERFRKKYMDSDWASVYDFIEYIADSRIVASNHWTKDFVLACNAALEKHVSAYRFVGTTLAPITSEEEIIAVEQAMSHGEKFKAMTSHLQAAIEHFGNRLAPDYRNSIKESISAVEAACQIITGDDNATLDKALKQIGIHPALQKGFGAIYGYTSDADGIRHALSGETNVTADDAKFFLVSCSAFVNYLIAKGSTGVTTP